MAHSAPYDTDKSLQPHPSLPARPPPSTYTPPPFRPNNVPQRGVGNNAFAGFAPRSVASRAPTVTAPQVYAPQMMTTQAPMNGAGYQPTAYPQQGSYYPQQSYVNPAAPTIINPFLNQGAKNGAYDPEMEARIAEWSSAYMPKDDAAGKKPTGNDTSYGSTQSVQVGHSDSKNVASGVEGEKKKTVVRQGGGKVWEDTSLTEWDPSHPRLMVGNLAGEVTDESLLKAFSKYPSVQKTRVVRDKRTTKSKGYGFVSFSDTDDFFRAAKEMKGKYIGSHPVTVERARTEIKVTTEKDRKHGKNGKKSGGGGGGKGDSGHHTGAGVQKHTHPKKDKSSLKILG